MNNQRHKFEIPHNICYLNHAYMSPQMTHISDIGKKSVEQKNFPWTIGADDFFDKSEATRFEFSKLIDATADDIAIIPSVSYGIGVAARNTKLYKNDEVLLLDEQFPSNVYPWIEKAKRKEAVVVFANKSNDETWTDALLKKVSTKTKVIAIPNVHWTDGSVIDLKRISKVCKENEIILVVDATQSLGAMQFSIKDIDADFVVAAAYKWLMGPYSLGFMYVSKRFQSGKPIEFNWINKEHSEQFAGLVNYKEAYQPGARRFDVGERSNFALIPMALAALQQLNTWTVDAIGNYISPILSQISNIASEAGYMPTPENQRAPHMMGIAMSNEKALELFKHFKNNDIYVSVRGNSIRISPHVYTTKNDMDRFAEAMKK